MENFSKIRLFITIIAFVTLLIVLFVLNLMKINKIKNGKTKNKKNKNVVIIEVQYLSIKYKIVKERLYTKGYAFLFAFIDSLIICTTFLVIDLIPWAFAFQILIGFVLLIGFIYAIYGILGSILVKRGYQNELQ